MIVTIAFFTIIIIISISINCYYHYLTPSCCITGIYPHVKKTCTREFRFAQYRAQAESVMAGDQKQDEW